LWTWSASFALAVLAFYSWLIIHRSATRALFGPISGRGGTVYLFFGFGVATAIFPSAASTFSKLYEAMASSRMTRAFAFVGWILIFVSGVSLLLSLW